jgi:malonyl-CoA O-methyltransferase
MTIRAAYTHWATTYDTDRNLTRDLDQSVTRATLESRHFGTILELGCGTGKNTALLRDISDRVCALDFSDGMIRQAQLKLAEAPGGNVLFAVTDFRQPWPCADHSVDLIVCNLVLEHIADLGMIFAEARRVLVTGGQFFLCELHPFKQYQGKKATFERGDQQIQIDAFVHHLSDFLDAAAAAGFQLERLQEWWHEADPPTAPRLVSFMFRD